MTGISDSTTIEELAALVSEAFHPECRFTLEFPPWPLAVGSELVREWNEQKVANGVIQMLSPTQCVMDRLAAYYFWKDRQALDQAVAVARTHGADNAEIQRWSEAEGRLTEFLEFVRALQQTDG